VPDEGDVLQIARSAFEHCG